MVDDIVREFANAQARPDEIEKTARDMRPMPTCERCGNVVSYWCKEGRCLEAIRNAYPGAETTTHFLLRMAKTRPWSWPLRFLACALAVAALVAFLYGLSIGLP